MKIALLLVAVALCVSRGDGQTCSNFFADGEVPSCSSTKFRTFSDALGTVRHRFVSRSGSFRIILRASSGLFVDQMAAGVFTSDQGRLRKADLPDTKLFSPAKRAGAISYNPKTLPATSGCCGDRLFIYTWGRISEGSAGSGRFTVGVTKNIIDYPCTDPCAGTSGTVVEYGMGERCPSCDSASALPKCSMRCSIDCSKPRRNVLSTMAAECEDDVTGMTRTCACPPFDPTVETDNANCVMDLVAPTVNDRVNFGVLENVGFYRVTAPDAPPSLRDGYKIEFEKDVTDSTFCELEMSGALEIRRGFTNSFIGSTKAGRNLRIIDFAKLKNSVFGPISFFNAFIEQGVEILDCTFEEWNSRDNVNFKDAPDCAPPATCSTPIMGNTFLNITAVKNCAVKFTPDVSDNTFGVFNFAGTTGGCRSIGFAP